MIGLIGASVFIYGRYKISEYGLASTTTEEKPPYWNFEFRGIDIAKITPRGLHDELIQKGKGSIR